MDTAKTPKTTITYNGNEIASLEVGQTATLSCRGKKMKTDIVVAFGADGSITYNDIETAVASGKTATLKCEGKKMITDVVVTTITSVALMDADGYVITDSDGIIIIVKE